MTNTQIIDVELSRPGWQANIFAVAGDMYSRYIEVHLYNGGQPYEPPSGTTCMIGWWRNDTEFGSYNSVMTDDHSTRQAWRIDGNVVTIELNWQIAQKAGKVGVNVALIGTDGSRISTWEMLCDVQRGPVAEADDPTLPSESATDAANRAEAAAERSEAVADELENIVKDGPVVSVNGKTGRVQLSASDIPFDNAGTPFVSTTVQDAILENIVKDDPVVSVNGKTGRVQLSASDIPFDNAGTPFVSTTVQDAIEELLGIGGGGGGGTASSTITVTAPAGAVVTVSKGDKSYTKTVGEDGAALSFKVRETGNWTVSAVLNGRTYKRTVNVAEAGGSYSVELGDIQGDIQEVLGDNSWAVIKRVADADEGANWWSVGDTKRIVLNGKIGILQANVMAIDVFILGFNHNAIREGQHLIHFAIGKISGKQVALCDNYYNSNSNYTCFHMNNSDDNGGGWNQSYMRKTILGNSGSPSSPPADSLLAALPADLRAVMQSVNKYTDNTGHSSNSSGAVTVTEDFLFLLAEFELYGSRKYANPYERNSQQQYDYFKAGNPKTFGKHNATGTVVWAWSRSPNSSSTNYFLTFDKDGTSFSNGARHSGGLFAGFAV